MLQSVLRIRAGKEQGTGVIVGDGSRVVTCGHCLRVNPFREYRLSECATPIKAVGHGRFSEGTDLAVVEFANPIGVPIRMAHRTPVPGEEVVLAGYPLGIEELVATVGNVGSTFVCNGYRNYRISAFNVGGFSGGAVLAHDGMLLGVLQGNHPVIDAPHNKADGVTETQWLINSALSRHTPSGIAYMYPATYIRDRFAATGAALW